MNDPDIRQLLTSYLSRRKAYSSKKLLEEVALKNGSIRADMVYCSRKLECFEIKSHNDSLKRLISQGWQYEQSFDLVTLVSASKHLSVALGMIPEWWGIVEVTKSGSLKRLRAPRQNPNVSIPGIVDVLTNDESKAFLASIGCEGGVSKLSHSELKSTIQDRATISSLRKWVLSTLQSRQQTWKSDLSNGHNHEVQLSL